MVIGAPDVDDAIKTALELVEVIGNVGGELGVDAVVALDHAIFFIAKSRGAEP